MTRIFILLSLIVCQSLNGQSLKDALYGGKLKSDSGSVVRKSDDLSTKIDTTRKNIPEPAKQPAKAITNDPSKKTEAAPLSDSNSAPAASAVTKDNNRLWKEFMDSMAVTFKDEILSSKKIKSGTYYVLVDYTIDISGQVSINGIYPSPENSFLAEEIKKRLLLYAPALTPVAGSNGKPRKVVKKYNLILTK